MDTNDLTEMANETLARAYAVCDVLRAEIAVSAADFKTEDAFLRGTLEFLDEILEDPEGYLDEWNLLDEKDVESFAKGVGMVRDHVAATLNTPAPGRGRPAFEQ